jgi:hypothetical protein
MRNSLDGDEVGHKEVVQEVWAGSEAVVPQLRAQCQQHFNVRCIRTGYALASSSSPLSAQSFNQPARTFDNACVYVCLETILEKPQEKSKSLLKVTLSQIERAKTPVIRDIGTDSREV